MEQQPDRVVNQRTGEEFEVVATAAGCRGWSVVGEAYTEWYIDEDGQHYERSGPLDEILPAIEECSPFIADVLRGASTPSGA